MSSRRTVWNARRLPVPSVVDLDDASYVHLGVARVAAALSVSLYQLRREICDGRYTSVLGEDTSGRLLSLIAWRAINEHRVAGGAAALPITFVQGAKTAELAGSVEQTVVGSRVAILRGATPSPRTLLITDMVSTGSTLVPIAAGLRQLAVGFDIATLDLSTGIESLRRRGSIDPDTRIAAAGMSSSWDARTIPSGLLRDKYPDVAPDPQHPNRRHMPGPVADPDRRELARTRQATVLAGRAIAAVLELA